MEARAQVQGRIAGETLPHQSRVRVAGVKPSEGHRQGWPHRAKEAQGADAGSFEEPGREGGREDPAASSFGVAN